MNKVKFPKVEFVDFYRTEGSYNLLNRFERSAQYVFNLPHLTPSQINEMGLQISYLVDIDKDYGHDPKEMTALDLAYELKEYYGGFFISSNEEPIKKLYSYLSEIEEEQEKIRNKYKYEYALAKVEQWTLTAKEMEEILNETV